MFRTAAKRSQPTFSQQLPLQCQGLCFQCMAQPQIRKPPLPTSCTGCSFFTAETLPKKIFVQLPHSVRRCDAQSRSFYHEIVSAPHRHYISPKSLTATLWKLAGKQLVIFTSLLNHIYQQLCSQEKYDLTKHNIFFFFIVWESSPSHCQTAKVLSNSF